MRFCSFRDMESARRRGRKPEWTSETMLLAMARWVGSWGQRDGTFSARYSQMARESQMTTSPSQRTGTFLVGENGKISCLNELDRWSNSISSKGNSENLTTSQGRIDQDDVALFPIISLSIIG